MRAVKNVFAFCAIAVTLVVTMDFVTSACWGRPDHARRVATNASGHVVGKVPAAETGARYERIDLMTMSAASAAGHPLEILVQIQGAVSAVQCKCAPEFYRTVRTGDEIAVVVRRDGHCFVPDSP